MSFIARNLSRIVVQASSRGLHTTPVALAAHQEPRVKCTMIPGDGVGPELMYAVQELFKAGGIPVDFETFFVSEINPVLSAPIEDVIKSIKKNKICLGGILASADYSPTGDPQNINMKLRTGLDLYANVVHVMSLPGVKTRHTGIDCVIIREQTEGEYSALEHESVPGLVECLKIVTEKKSIRIAKFAFDYATKQGRKKVTCVHKANIMKLGDGLFLKCCETVAKLYPKIEFEKMIVDNTTMQMVSNPHQFDVLVTPNLYGSIVDNIACGLVGGAGVVPGASFSTDSVVFQPGARHTFAVGVGKNIANPTAMFLCAAKMLKHVNLPQYCDQIVNAIKAVLNEGKILTKDMGGQSTTLDFTNAVISHLQDIEH